MGKEFFADTFVKVRAPPSQGRVGPAGSPHRIAASPYGPIATGCTNTFARPLYAYVPCREPGDHLRAIAARYPRDVEPHAGDREGHRLPHARLARGFRELQMPIGFHHLIGGDHYACPENNESGGGWTVPRPTTTSRRAGVGFGLTRAGSAPSIRTRSRIADRWNDVIPRPRTCSSVPSICRVTTADVRTTLLQGLVAHYQRAPRRRRRWRDGRR